MALIFILLFFFSFTKGNLFYHIELTFSMILSKIYFFSSKNKKHKSLL